MSISLKSKGIHLNTQQPKITIVNVLFSLGCVLVCFSCGMLFGSHLAHNTTISKSFQKPNRLSSLGQFSLPGTNNILKKWDPHLYSENLNLRGGLDPDHESLVESPQLAAARMALRGHESSPSKDSQHSLSTNIDFSISLHATTSTYVEAPPKLDVQNILIGAWIYLDDLGSSDNDMRTIFSNKASGCGHNQEQYGISLYVNAWQTSDKKLYAEYGGRDSGCYKIDSGSIELKSNKWYHVAVSFSGDYGRIFIDGIQVGKSSQGVELHSVQERRPMIIGQYDSGQYPFMGNISHFAVIANPPSDPTELLALVASMKEPLKIDSINGIITHYPFSDAVNRPPNAQDTSSHRNHAKYHFPLHGTEINGVKIPLIDGTSSTPTEEDKSRSDSLGRERREKIKSAMKWVWSSYKKYAWGADELKPISRTANNNWGGMGVTLVDSLDTLWIMGLKEEFEDAKRWVEKSLNLRHASGSLSVFETTIRELGGLIAAYDLSGDKIFLNRAIELGDLLLPAFDTPTGIPYSHIDFQSHHGGHGWSGSSAILSELGSLQIEFRYLSYKTNQIKYEHQSMRALQLMNTKHPSHGLYPIKVSMNDGNFVENTVTFGALGDSFYEYLLKVWIQGGKKETWLREMYDRAIDGVMDVLLQASSPSGLAFLGDWNGHSINRKMDHLVCFMPGTMALGAMHDPRGKDSERAKRDLSVAKALMYTCREMYHRMESGISAEYVEFPQGRDIQVPGYVAFYILRPETAESLFYLNQLTGDPIYREWAWEIWEAIDKHCRTSIAYGSLPNVHNPSQGIDDRMESFFLAETMKYLYLAQDPDNTIDLNKYVFNTEAHPTLIFDDSHKPVKP